MAAGADLRGFRGDDGALCSLLGRWYKALLLFSTCLLLDPRLELPLPLNVRNQQNSANPIFDGRKKSCLPDFSNWREVGGRGRLRSTAPMGRLYASYEVVGLALLYPGHKSRSSTSFSL